MSSTSNLQFPPGPGSEIQGIFQSTLMIRSALLAAIADLRVNPYLLDYVFASMANDPLTSKDYGNKEIQQARKWFLATNFTVNLSASLNNPNLPVFSISLLESAPAEETLADIHYVPQEDNDSQWPTLVDTFAATGYDEATSTLTVPDSISKQLVLFPGQMVIDSVGQAHRIIEVPDNNNLILESGTVADFSRVQIKGARPAYVTYIESTIMRESYMIGCHVQNEPVHLTYMHSILVFILLRYKQSLFEARGFERSTFTSSDFMRNDGFEMENVFSRHVKLTGYVRQSWPKITVPKITGLASQLIITPVGQSASSPHELVLDPEDAWMADQDSLGLIPK